MGTQGGWAARGWRRERAASAPDRCSGPCQKDATIQEVEARVSDLLGGQVNYMFDSITSARPHIQSGKLRALAVTTAKRSSSMPDVPTMEEAGIKGYEVSPWFAVTLSQSTAPWAFWRGEPFRSITALEVMASLVAMCVFQTAAPPQAEVRGIVQMTGLTDSKVAAAVIGKGATTSWPLCLLSMELGG